MLLPREITEEIIFLLGTRQTGKTTLTKLVAKASHFKPSETFFFDFEDKKDRGFLGTGAVSALRYLLRKIVPGLESQDSCSNCWIQS